jgi:hypothetical protein
LHINANADNALSVVKFNLIEEIFSHGLKSFFRPGKEPIDSAAIYERWEHSQSALKLLTDWRHSKNQMNICLCLGQEVIHDLTIREVLEGSIVLISFFHRINDVSDVFSLCVKIGNDTAIQDVVDVFNESLESNLSVREHKYCLLLINTSAHVQLLFHVISPLLETVILRNLNLEVIKHGNESGELGEGFTA